MKCKRTTDGRKFDHHTLQVMRQQAIKAVREGQTATSVAAAFGLNVRTVFTWLATIARDGRYHRAFMLGSSAAPEQRYTWTTWDALPPPPDSSPERDKT